MPLLIIKLMEEFKIKGKEETFKMRSEQCKFKVEEVQLLIMAVIEC